MKKNGIAVRDALVVDNKIWFCPGHYKSLCSLDMSTNERKGYVIPTEGLYTKGSMFSSMAVVGNKIYLIPLHDKVIMQFNIESKEFQRIELVPEIVGDNSELFAGVSRWGDYLFVWGARNPMILKLNTLNNQIDYIVDCKQKAQEVIFDYKDVCFRSQGVISDDKLFLPFCNANAILEVDCISMETVIHRLGEEKQGYSGICLEGKALWLSPRKKGRLVKWDLKTKKMDEIQMPGLSKAKKEYVYVGIAANNAEKILCPFWERQSVRIEDQNITELDGRVGFVRDEENYIIMAGVDNGIITVINKSANSWSEFRIGKIDVDVEKILIENNNIVVENDSIGILNFMEYINAGL